MKLLCPRRIFSNLCFVTYLIHNILVEVVFNELQIIELVLMCLKSMQYNFSQLIGVLNQKTHENMI